VKKKKMKNDKNIRKGITAILIAIMMLIVVFTTTTITANAQDDRYTIMHPDIETLKEWMDSYSAAPQISIVGIKPAGSHSVLGHVDYVPVDRDQEWCGNCWAWAGTGCMEVAHDVDNGVFKRLSIQYLNSLYNGGTGADYACCGGSLSDLAGFYSTTTFAIPWDNTNANWQDANTCCHHPTNCPAPWDETTVPATSISTTPHYDITSIAASTITTHAVGQAAAIANIKDVLDNDNAIYFSFCLPDKDDWDNFKKDFWRDQSETAVWSPDYSCGHTWIDGEGGCHAVLCVGYDDTDSDNKYWTMLNSWGTAGGRPNGLFRVDMDINYDCTVVLPDGIYYSLNWQMLDIDFEDNQPPEADAGDDQTFEQAYYQGADVPLDGSGSSDPDGDPLTYSWTWTGGSATGVTPTVSLPLGTTIITLTVSDGSLTDTDTVSIAVEDTTEPSVDAGSDIPVEQATAAGTEVTLSATVSDICDASPTVTWSHGPTAVFPLGSTTVTVTATDDSGNSASDTVVVNVVDTTPPDISVTVSPDTLWPPNHKMVDITATVTVNDICDAAPTVVLSVTSDEPDNAIGDGDGNTINDIQAEIGTEDYEFQLRAERAGTGDGRVYTITYTATDESGNSASDSATVVVPHDMD
jgi:hypothetical protein